MKIIGLIVGASALVLPPSGRRAPARRFAAPFEAVDLSGDGGVVKVASSGGGSGSPDLAADGAVGVLRYAARTASGQLLDAAQDAQYTVGDASFVAGWDLCARSLSVGEAASFEVAPAYAYGARGVPPAVKPNEALSLEIACSEYRGNVRTSASFASDTPLTPRTADAIKAEYERRRSSRAVDAGAAEDARALREIEADEAGVLGKLANAVDDAKEKFSGLYFFGFFESATGEAPPWYLQPMLTFPAIFLGVGLSFLVLQQSDAILLRGANSPIPGEGVGFSL